MSTHDYTKFLTDTAGAKFIRLAPGDKIPEAYEGKIAAPVPIYLLEEPTSTAENVTISGRISNAIADIPPACSHVCPAFHQTGEFGSENKNGFAIVESDLDKVLGKYVDASGELKLPPPDENAQTVRANARRMSELLTGDRIGTRAERQ